LYGGIPVFICLSVTFTFVDSLREFYTFLSINHTLTPENTKQNKVKRPFYILDPFIILNKHQQIGKILIFSKIS